MSASTSYYLQGRQGGYVVSDDPSGTAEADGRYCWIQALKDSTLVCTSGNTTAENIEGFENLGSSLTLLAGQGIGGIFSRVVVATGAVIAYYA